MNATVTLICGKIASGKTTLAARLRQERRAVLLSCDEVMLALFDERLGQRHDEVAARTQAYLLRKAAEIAGAGIPVILDWGFWTRREREEVTRFFRSRDIPTEWMYVDATEARRSENLRGRNSDVRAGRSRAYFIDDAIAEKCTALFEAPERDEVDVWIDGARLLDGRFTMSSEL